MTFTSANRNFLFNLIGFCLKTLAAWIKNEHQKKRRQREIAQAILCQIKVCNNNNNKTSRLPTLR